MKNYYKLDCLRRKDKMPIYQKFYRKQQSSRFVLKFLYKVLFKIAKFCYHVELPSSTEIGPGLFINHPFCITINPAVKIGRNCNLHKGVTIGQENRGKRKGCPVIGDCVWIGANSTIVGNITIGDDVLIAPNTFVNTDVPSHSVVFGCPCVVKHKDDATKDYVNNKI